MHETHLADWKRSAYHITEAHLKFELGEETTRVTADYKIKADDDTQLGEALVLSGEDLELESIALNGKKLDGGYKLEANLLTIPTQERDFVLEIKTIIHPAGNTQLAGLYKSGDILCTQNEAEGFRRITYFLDRPDNMSRYSVEIIGEKTQYPYLLSNGNLIESGNLPNGKHYTKWEDPFLKPCYLFALVAGDFGLVEDSYMTQSGRKIDLKIYCDKGNEKKCQHAMESLKKAMRWDEETFGLEYDLDLFMIVAVLSFNFGAMENKGLNIFNANAILVDEETATDENFMRVERVVAHEYFHNWTGNRVTVRDWFQLTLKEGLTVFRDQEFMQDMHDRGVLRIEDVHYLRRFQFPEDSGPTKHPIKPDSYIKIDNFYTTTIYQKGAEVVRMLKTLMGEACFRKGMDIYFELYDGKAVTTEDFLHAMERAYGQSLESFARWYKESGTPLIKIKKEIIPGGIALELEQLSNPLTFPLSVGFIDRDGKEIPIENATLKVEKSFEKFIFEGLPLDAVPSLNRRFSAPIKIESDLSKEERRLLMRHDTDPFSRWDAAYDLYTESILDMVSKHKSGQSLEADPELLDVMENFIKDESLGDATRALMLTMPSESEIGERQFIIDIDEIHAAREFLKYAIGQKYYASFMKLWQKLNGPSSGHDTQTIGKRKLKNCALSYLAASKEEKAFSLIYRQFEEALNMTDRMAALELLSNYPNPYREKALKVFYERWKDEPLVIIKWFSVQAASQMAGTVEAVDGLLRHHAFDEKVPNHVRALLGTFVQNPFHFHHASGKGYELIAREIICLDKINPYIAAGLAQGFKKYAQLGSKRKEMMRNSMEEILRVEDLSPNVFEIVSKCLSN